MKKVVLLVVAVLVGLVGFNYYNTGEITLIPSSPSDEARELRALEGRFNAAKMEFAQAGRATAMSGMDMTGDASVALAELDSVLRALAELGPRLTSDDDRRRADRLKVAIEDFRKGLR